MNDLQNNAEEPQDITVELVPLEIVAKTHWMNLSKQLKSVRNSIMQLMK